MKLYKILFKGEGELSWVLAHDLGEICQWATDVKPDNEILTVILEADKVIDLHTADLEDICPTPTE